MDGIWLGYRVTIATDLAESSEYSNQASGYYHAAMSPMAIGLILNFKFLIFINLRLRFIF